MIVNIKGIEFSPENLMAYIKMCGIRFSDIVYAQAVLETGGFKSMIFLESFNLFGMKVASSRPTTALSKSRGHALYDSWMMSVNDYALYQSAFLRDIRTSEDYLSYLSKHYAEDPAYVSKLRKIISKL
jgi:flagellum-specific peptidoglycan hydrolase FlgJ